MGFTLQRVLRRGSEKGVSRRCLEHPLREHDPLGVRPTQGLLCRAAIRKQELFLFARSHSREFTLIFCSSEACSRKWGQVSTSGPIRTVNRSFVCKNLRVSMWVYVYQLFSMFSKFLALSHHLPHPRKTRTTHLTDICSTSTTTSTTTATTTTTTTATTTTAPHKNPAAAWRHSG